MRDRGFTGSAGPRARLRVVGFCLVAALLAAGSLDAQVADELPCHLLLFVVDDLSRGDLGQGDGLTPALDAFARGAVVFSSACAEAPVGPPSRASLLTGLRPHRHGIVCAGHPMPGPLHRARLLPPVAITELPREIRSLPRRLAARGYVSASIGKWNLGPGPELLGFDVGVAGNRAAHPYGGYFPPYRNHNLADGPAGEHLSDRLTDEALHFLRGRGARPFFLYLSHFAMRPPLAARPDLVESLRRERPDLEAEALQRGAMLRGVDESFARLERFLRESGDWDRTLVVVTSDNGGRRPHAALGPLRGERGSLFEGGLAVPLIVKAPRRVIPRRIGVPVTGVDVAATLLDHAGADRRDIDGRSLRPLIDGLEAPEFFDRVLVWDYPAYGINEADPEGPWLETPSSALRLGRYKLILREESGHPELYDLETDPGESRDIGGEDEERRARLEGRLRAELAARGLGGRLERNPHFVDPERLAAARAGRRPRPAARADAPDLFLVLVEALGPEALEDPRLPTLRDLAARGLVLGDHYVGGADETTAQCVLMTGLDAGAAPVRGPRARVRGGFLPLTDGQETLPGLLAAAGYVTAHCGDWYLGGDESPGHPRLQGFDHFVGRLLDPASSSPALRRDFAILDPAGPDTASTGVGLNRDEAEDRADRLLAAAEDFLGTMAKDGPCFLVVRLPHADGGDEAAVVLDRRLTRLFRAFESRETARPQLLILSAAGAPTARTSANPWRGARGSLAEGGLRLPFVALRSPASSPARRLRLMSAQVDYLATFAAAAGVDPRRSRGSSLWPWIRGDVAAAEAREELYFELDQREQAFRRGDFKLYRPHPRRPLELYDLINDPGESRNLARERADLAEDLLQRLLRARLPAREFPLVR